jgi:hypothetical protein
MITKAKIVCTIGPASEEPKVFTKLYEEGMDVGRLNFIQVLSLIVSGFIHSIPIHI